MDVLEKSASPLETRSLPGALWEHAPRFLSEYDENLRAFIASHIDPGQHPWLEIRWLTENIWGVGLLTLFFVLSFFVINFKRISFKQSSANVFLLLLFVGVSDLIALAIKRVVGRLKPHVHWWDKNDLSLPALSFPSSHAFNSAFVLTLLVLSLDLTGRRRWRWPLRLGLAFSVLLGFSRVLLGQHYPSDVICGWLGGALFGAALVRSFQWCRDKMEPS